MKPLKTAGSCALLILLAACSDTSKKAAKPAEPEKPPEPVTGRYALYQMFTAARGWVPDVQPLRLNSIHLPEVKAERGKAAAWQVTFVSARSSRARSYTFSVIEGPGNLHKGVFALNEESWSGTGTAKPFLM